MLSTLSTPLLAKGCGEAMQGSQYQPCPECHSVREPTEAERCVRISDRVIIWRILYRRAISLCARSKGYLHAQLCRSWYRQLPVFNTVSVVFLAYTLVVYIGNSCMHRALRIVFIHMCHISLAVGCKKITTPQTAFMITEILGTSKGLGWD